MASKWDDEFDLDELDNKHDKKKQKAKKDDYDFFDLDEDNPPKNSKLPTINSKNTQKEKAIANNNKSKKQIPKSNIYDDYEEIDQEVEVIPSTKKQPLKTNFSKKDSDDELEDLTDIKQIPQKQKANVPFKSKNNQSYDNQQFEEQIQEKSSPVTKPLEKKIENKSVPLKNRQQTQKEQEQYQEQVFDQYGQDFEQQIQEPKKAVKPAEVNKKSNTQANLKPKLTLPQQNKQKNQQINSNKIFSNKQLPKKQQTITKPVTKPVAKPPSIPNKQIQQKGSKHGVSQQKQFPKNTSKQSIKSTSSQKFIVNNSSQGKKTIQVKLRKHQNLVQQSFPFTQDKISQMAPDKLTKVNQQIREMIRKFNQQLNQLINKNMVLIKQKSPEKTYNIDNKLRVLQQQLSSGSTAEEVVQNQLQKLMGRQGQLKQEQYLLIMQKRTQEVKQQMKETLKQITKLKVVVNSEGNKLSKQQLQKKMAQDLHQIKLMLMQVKKQQQKHQQKIVRLQKTYEQLESKHADIQYALSQQIDLAKEKGIELNVKQQQIRKYQTLKNKVNIIDQHKKSMENLYKSKLDIIYHQNQQTKISIRNIQSQIHNVYSSIDRSQQDSLVLIKKTKQMTNVSEGLIQNLDKILKAIQENQANNSYEVRTQGNTSRVTQRSVKRSTQDNMTRKDNKNKSRSTKKDSPSRNKIEQSPKNDQLNLMKPNFMKKKHQRTQQAKDDSENQRLQRERILKIQEQKKRQQEQKKQKQLLKAAEQTNKPFTLKKNRLKSSQPGKESQNIIEVQNKQQKQLKLDEPIAELKQQQKPAEKPSLGPKFMRLNKRKDKDDASQNDISQPVKEAPPKAIDAPVAIQEKAKNQDQQQPNFVPRRLNLRNKLAKKEENYTPSIQPSKSNQVEKNIQQPKSQYVPNTSFKNEELFKAEEKKVDPPQTRIQVQQEKPRINLRLRDRKKENAEENSYIPSRVTQPEPSSKIYGEQKPKKQEEKYVNLSGKNVMQAEKDLNNQKASPLKGQPISQKQNINNAAPVNNPYAPVSNNANPYAPKPAASNPYAPAKEDNSSNPYLPKQQPSKREKQGPIKKIKIQKDKAPKERLNIYDQAEDLTQPVAKNDLNEPVSNPYVPKNVQESLMKTDQLDLNAMLGIKKKQKGNDLDDLLGEIGGGNKKKERKRNDDFFNDLEL